MPFARFIGTLYWDCPSCSHMNRSKTHARTYSLQCDHCKTLWLLGMTVWKKPPGRHRVPRDTLMIAGHFPNKRLVNRCFCDGCGQELSEKALADKTLE